MDITAEFIELEKHIEPSFLPIVEINRLTDNAYLSCRVVVSCDNEPRLILNIYSIRDNDGYVLEQCFKEIKIHQNIIVILHGVHLHLYNLEMGSTSSIALNDYVGHLYSIPDVYSDSLCADFIVTTFEYTFLVNINSGIKWRSGRCAIDGVVVYSIENGIINGAGDWDPPGGWKPFQLDLYTGSFLHLSK